MFISYEINNSFLIEKNKYISVLVDQFGFIQHCGDPEIFINKGTRFSLHLQNALVQINVREFPRIRLDVKSIFINKKMLKVFTEDLKQDLEIGKPSRNWVNDCWVLMRENSIAGLAELTSRMVFPSIMVVLWGVVVYTFLCLQLIKQVANELQFTPPVETGYLSYEQLSPSVIDLYSSGHSFLEAAILMSCLSGGWILGIQILVSCAIAGFICRSIVSVFICLLTIGVLFSLFYGTYFSQAIVIFSFFVGYLLFGLCCRNLPYFRKLA